jgi:hypothetical protein
MAVHGCVQHHFVTRIAKLRPPQKVGFYRLCQSDQGGQKDLDLLIR